MQDHRLLITASLLAATVLLWATTLTLILGRAGPLDARWAVLCAADVATAAATLRLAIAALKRNEPRGIAFHPVHMTTSLHQQGQRVAEAEKALAALRAELERARAERGGMGEQVAGHESRLEAYELAMRAAFELAGLPVPERPRRHLRAVGDGTGPMPLAGG